MLPGVANTADMTEPIVGLCYLAGFVIGLFLVRAVIRKVRRRRQPAVPSPAKKRLAEMIAPLGTRPRALRLASAR